jgi:sugar lactone lactonase YvrE
MKFRSKLAGSAVLLLIAYFALWPISVQPVGWNAPANPGFTGLFAPNNRLQELQIIPLDGREGPEDVAISADGSIYAATHSGEILVVDPAGKIKIFADTQGRPLGIEFGDNGILYVADGYLGLLSVDPAGDVKLLSNKTDDGSPVVYANDVDIAPDGTVYFSDATTHFSPRENGGAYAASVMDLVEHADTGRILRYDPASGQTSVFVEGLTFADGVAVNEAGDAVYVAETGSYRVWRFPTDGSEGKVVLENLPGFPDNINNAPDGNFWIGLVTPRDPLLDAFSGWPIFRKVFLRLPEFLMPGPVRYGFVLRMGPNGEVIETLQDPDGKFALTTGAVSLGDGAVVVSSITEPGIGILR